MVPPGDAAADEGALAVLLLGLGRGAWLAGFVAVPAAFFWAGVAAWDLLHGAYLLMAAAPVLWHTLQLQPQVCRCAMRARAAHVTRLADAQLFVSCQLHHVLLKLHLTF